MIKTICKECGKILEAYTQKQLDTILAQHLIKHQNELKQKQEKENGKP